MASLVGIGIPAINYSGILNVATMGIGSGLAIIAFLAVIMVIRYFMSFNIPFELIEQTGTGNRLKKGKGRLNHKKEEFQALGMKDYVFMWPLSDHFISAGKGLKLFGYAISNNVSWLKVSPNPGFVPADINFQTYLAQRLRRNWEATQNKVGFWDKYGHQVLWMATIVIFLIAIILILKQVEKAIAMGQSVLNARVQSM